MRIFKNLIITVSFFVLGVANAFCQPGPPGGGGGPGGGNPPCWPPSVCDPEIPINGELWLLLIAGLSLGYYFFMKEKALATKA